MDPHQPEPLALVTSVEEVGDTPAPPAPPAPPAGGGGTSGGDTPSNDDTSDPPNLSDVRNRVFTTILNEDGSNYLSWKSLLPLNLQMLPYAWECVSGTLVGSKGTTPEDKKQQAKFNEGNLAARYVLLNSIHQSILVNLFYEDLSVIPASLIWKKIQENFAQTTPAQKFAAVCNFMNWSYRSDKTVRDNINTFKRLKYALDECNANFPEDIVCIALINKLPANWTWIKVLWLPKPQTEQTLGNLVTLILTEAARRESEHPEAATAMISRTHRRTNNWQRSTNRRANTRVKNNSPRQASSSSSSTIQASSNASTGTSRVTVTCTYCKKTGHAVSNCFAKRNAKKRSAANIAECYLTQHGAPRVLDPKASREFQEWILDSGATHHIVNDRKLFSSYNAEEGIRNVRLGGARSLRVKGSGIVKLTVLNGNVSSTITLNNTLYVPSMGRRLVSLSKLASDNYGISVYPHAIQLKKDGNDILAPHNGGLYVIHAQ